MNLLTRGLLATFLLLACAMAGPVQAQGSSTFQESCDNIRVSGDMLFADCQRIDGSWTRSSIPIPNIENIDGDLQYSDGPSTYQNSCTNIDVSGDTLFADCRRINGSWNTSSIRMPGIENIDGDLQYQ